MAQTIPEALAHLVALNAEFNVLICTQCKYAVASNAISRHLGDRHKVPIKLRKQLDKYIQAFPFPYDHIRIQLPSNGSAPQPVVPVLNGYLCKDCPYISQNRDVIRQHINAVHHKKRLADEDLFKPVQIQSWFAQKRARYWTVDLEKQTEQERQTRRTFTRDVGEQSDDDEDDNSDQDIPDPNEMNNQDAVDDQINYEIAMWKAESQERRTRALKEVPAVEVDSWLQYTKWNEVLSRSKHGLVETFQYTRMPDPEEPELERLLRAWNHIVKRCLDTLAATDHKDALKWWASPQNEAASQRPFELPQREEQTIPKYSKIWACFICYIMRTAPVEDYDEETGM